jgi:hypothetical protein
VADELQIAPGEVSDGKLAVFCDRIRDDPTDILVLCGCRRVTNISCLVQLSTISHLDISGCYLGAKGGFHLAGVIKNMGALLVLSLKSNNLRAGGGKALAGSLKGNQVITELNIADNGLCVDGRGSADTSGVIALADIIPDMGALAKLDASDNDMFGLKNKTGITAWAAALKACTSITELNLAKNGINANDTKILAPAISDMGALSTLIFSVGKYDDELITMEASMTEADFSGKGLGVSGAMILAAFLPKCTYVPEYLFPIFADTPTPTTGRYPI